jgi:cytochrome c-type biogenesis protein CcmH/NrfF
MCIFIYYNIKTYIIFNIRIAAEAVEAVEVAEVAEAVEAFKLFKAFRCLICPKKRRAPEWKAS